MYLSRKQENVLRLLAAEALSIPEMVKLSKYNNKTILTALRKAKATYEAGFGWSLPIGHKITGVFKPEPKRIGRSPESAVTTVLLRRSKASIGAIALATGWSRAMIHRTVHRMYAEGKLTQHVKGRIHNWSICV